MPATYEPIATNTVSTTTATITFNSIPSTYTDLVLICNTTSGTAADIYLRFNSDTGSNYSRTYIYGDGSSAVSGRNSNNTFFYFTGQDTSGIVNTIGQIQNYSNSTTNKTILARVNSAGVTNAAVHLWRSTAAINTITLTTSTGNFNTGSTFTLYGIKAA